MVQGAATLQGRSLQPTFTIANHVSILTGLTPTTHGILEPADPGDTIVDNTIIEIAHTAGLTTGIYISKDKLRLFRKPGIYDQYVMTNTGTAEPAVKQLIADLALPDSQWQLIFLHIVDPDYDGHLSGWMSKDYMEAVQRSDAYVRRILDSVEQQGLSSDTVVFILSDHGGFETNHVDDLPEVTTIPWLAAGPGIREDYSIFRTVGVHDTAPTILRVLGLPIPAAMEGTVLWEVFSDMPQTIRRGDANADENVNISDAIVALNHLFLGSAAACPHAADVDADGIVSITDAIYLLTFLFRGGRTPAPPFPECGLPEPSALPCSVFCTP
jgi:hypothetical protein